MLNLHLVRNKIVVFFILLINGLQVYSQVNFLPKNNEEELVFASDIHFIDFCFEFIARNERAVLFYKKEGKIEMFSFPIKGLAEKKVRIIPINKKNYEITLNSRRKKFKKMKKAKDISKCFYKKEKEFLLERVNDRYFLTEVLIKLLNFNKEEKK